MLTPTSADFKNGNPDGLRRNTFYTNHGFKLNLNEYGEGISFETFLDDLVVRDSWKKNILEIEIQDYIRNITSNEEMLLNQNLRLSSAIDQYNISTKNVNKIFQENKKLKNYLIITLFLLAIGVIGFFKYIF